MDEVLKLPGEEPKVIELGWADELALAVIGATQDITGITGEDQERILAATYAAMKPHVPAGSFASNAFPGGVAPQSQD